MSDKHDLALLIRQSTPILLIETQEELRTVDLFCSLLTQVWRPLFKWSITEGLVRLDIDDEAAKFSVKDIDDPVDALDHIKKVKERGIYLLLDFHPYLQEPKHVRLLKEIAQQATASHSLVFISADLNGFPKDLLSFAVKFSLSMPGLKVLEKIVRDEAFNWSKDHGGRRVEVHRKTLNMLTKNLQGLSEQDARSLARNAIRDDGIISDVDIPRVMEAKFKLLHQGGILSYEYDTAKLTDIAGLNNLKQWLMLRKPFFEQTANDIKLDPPKGLLLLGVQGCGKSLAAKAVAGGFSLPLLRLDCAALHDKFHGETEKNLRKSLATAEVMAPCVLWIDEIEKGIAISDYDSSTSKRVLGTFLTWMAERKPGVFMVATANDIHSMPPELMRKGRFDEIFFVDLPDEQTRRGILTIHLNNREVDCSSIDIKAIAAVTTDFSGAELEQVIVSALYASYARQEQITTDDLIKSAASTQPLAIVRKEAIQALREWAKNRTVAA